MLFNHSNPQHGTVGNGVDLYALLEGLPVGANSELGGFVDQTFLHPNLDLVLVFPPEWDTFNYPIAVGAVRRYWVEGTPCGGSMRNGSSSPLMIRASRP